MKRLNILAATIATLCSITQIDAKIALIGDNAPYGVVADGDFKEVWANWRTGTKPPFWDMYKEVLSPNAYPTDSTTGLYMGRMFGANKLTIARSKPLAENPLYQTPREGDRLTWEFGADVEYISKCNISLSLIFGEHERSLAKEIPLKGSDRIVEHFSGEYTLTAEDAAAGLPSIEVRMVAENAIKVFLNYINIYVESDTETPVKLHGMGHDSSRIALMWRDTQSSDDVTYNIYRAESVSEDGRARAEYKLVGSTKELSYLDQGITSGLPYSYVVTREGEQYKGSNAVVVATKDANSPSEPTSVKAEGLKASIMIRWSENKESDISHYSIERGDRVICSNTTKTQFEDILAIKGVDNRYRVYAHDYSGNRSAPSNMVTAHTELIAGASFGDLILPIPIVSELRSDLWGADAVLPRDPDNGVESPEWSYWGGRPVEDHDGKFHMCVTRWPETALKGHWEWPISTVAYVVADNPIGPYKVVRDKVYDFKDGLGHNPDIILLNDGTYALYSLISWEPTIFTSKTMAGPWERLGVLSFDRSEADAKFETMRTQKSDYQFQRNLSGVQIEDGTIYMVTKNGAMMVSENGFLGPYVVKTEKIAHNKTLDKGYDHFNYEDPVIWRDSVQFHMIINAFIAKRAIYLRSGNGLDWVYDPGLAYTNELTNYENGVPNYWDKLERPHVLQDKHGRATHLSLAVIDVEKDHDYGSDKHSSKNIIVPLVPHRLISYKGDLRVVVHAEEGFDPSSDLDLESLRFGASNEVNYGRGARVVSSKKLNGGDLELTFAGESGLNETDFAIKLLGKNRDGSLVIAFCRP